MQTHRPNVTLAELHRQAEEMELNAQMQKLEDWLALGLLTLAGLVVWAVW